MAVTYFQANIKLGTQRRTGDITVKTRFSCGGSMVNGTPVTFPLGFNPGETQTSVAHMENIDIKKGDRIDVEVNDVNTGALIGTFTGTVNDIANNNVIECLIYRGANQ